MNKEEIIQRLEQLNEEGLGFIPYRWFGEELQKDYEGKEKPIGRLWGWDIYIKKAS